MDFKALFPSSTRRPGPTHSPEKSAIFFNALRNNLSLSTWLLLGATLQTLLFLILPQIYALTPAIAILLIRSINTALITFGLKANPYLESVIPTRMAAQAMGKDGNYAGPGQEKIAVLLLGSKSNHPLGVFAPDFKLVGDRLHQMTKELEGDETQENGFLGNSSVSRYDANGCVVNIQISYWRSVEDVHRYAHGPTHRAVWKWWDSTLKDHAHIGIMHEVYEADKGKWESVFINFQPTMLGATTYLKKGGKIEGGNVSDEWVSPLLDASRGLLRTSNGRRGVTHQTFGEHVSEKDVYST